LSQIRIFIARLLAEGKWITETYRTKARLVYAWKVNLFTRLILTTEESGVNDINQQRNMLIVLDGLSDKKI
jgi:hypothetical protein